MAREAKLGAWCLFEPHPLRGRSLRSVTRAVLRFQPRATFPVYCDRARRGKYYLVVILRRRDQLARVAHAVTGVRGRRGGGWQRALGFCHSLDVLRKTKRGWRSDRLAGFIVLLENQLGSGYVTHEMVHAAHFRLCRAGGRDRRPLEALRFDDRRLQEPLADMSGWLVAQFWSAFYRRFPAATPGIVRKAA